jgi:hypothetical protein
MKVLADLILEYRITIVGVLVLGWIQSNIRIDALQKELDDFKRKSRKV